MSGGAVADDFDNDGYLDIFVSTWDTRGQIRFFRNNRDGTFTERTAEAGLLGLYGGLNMVQADYDNDGDVDLLVLRGAWLRADGRHPNSLLRNDGEGTFTDVTFDAGLGEVHTRALRQPGATTTTTATSTCTSATKRPVHWSPRASSFATTATARSRTLPKLPPS